MGAYFAVDDAGNSYKLRIAGDAPSETEMARIGQFIAQKNAAIPKPAPEPQGGIVQSGLEFGKGALRGLGHIGSDTARTVGGIGDYLAGYDEPGAVSRFGKYSGLGLDEMFAPAPGYEDSLSSGAGQLTGMLGGFLIPASLAAKPLQAGATAEEALAAVNSARRLAMAGEATLGAGVGGGDAQRRMDEYEQAKGVNVDPESRAVGTLLGAALGTTFAIPVDRLAKPLAQMLRFVPKEAAATAAQTIGERLKDTAITGGVAGVQNVIYGIGQDLVEKGLYNPDMDPTQSVMSNLTVGGGVGALMHFALGKAYNDRLRPHKQLSEDLVAEDQAAGELKSKQAAELDRLNKATGEALSPSSMEAAQVFTADTVGEGLAKHGDILSAGKPGADQPRRPYVLHEEGGVRPYDDFDQPLGPVMDGEDALQVIKDYEISKPPAQDKEPFDVAEPRSFREKLEYLQGELDDLRARKDYTKPEKDQDTSWQVRDQRERNLKEQISRLRSAREKDDTVSIRELSDVGLNDIVGALSTERMRGNAPDLNAPVTIKEMSEALTRLNKEKPRFELKRDARTVFDMVDAKRKTDYLAAKEAKAKASPDLTTPANWANKDYDIPVEVYHNVPGEKGADGRIYRKARDPATRRDTYLPEDEIKYPEAKPEPDVRPQPDEPALDTRPRPDEAAAFAKQFIEPGPPAEPLIPTGTKPNPSVVRQPKVDLEDLGLKPVNTEVFNKLQQRLHGYGLQGVALKLRRWLDTYATEGAVTIDGGVPKVIELATGIYRKGMSDDELLQALAKIMDHEVFHAIANVLDAKELKALENFVAKTKMPGKTYTYLQYHQAKGEGKPHESIAEEAMADAFKDWASGDLKISGEPRSLFAKIVSMFKRIGDWWTNAPEARDVFEKIKSGEMAKRAPKPQPPRPGGGLKTAAIAMERKYSKKGKDDEVRPSAQFLIKYVTETDPAKRQIILRDAAVRDLDLMKDASAKYRVFYTKLLKFEQDVLRAAYESKDGTVPDVLEELVKTAADQADYQLFRTYRDAINLKPGKGEESEWLTHLHNQAARIRKGMEEFYGNRPPHKVMWDVGSALQDMAFQRESERLSHLFTSTSNLNREPPMDFAQMFKDMGMVNDPSVGKTPGKKIEFGEEPGYPSDAEGYEPDVMKWPELHGTPEWEARDPMNPENVNPMPPRERRVELLGLGYKSKEIDEIIEAEYPGHNPKPKLLIDNTKGPEKKFSTIGRTYDVTKVDQTPDRDGRISGEVFYSNKVTRQLEYHELPGTDILITKTMTYPGKSKSGKVTYVVTGSGFDSEPYGSLAEAKAAIDRKIPPSDGKKFSTVGIDGTFAHAPRTPEEYKYSIGARVARALDPATRIRNLEHAAFYNSVHDYLVKPGVTVTETLKSRLMGTTADPAVIKEKSERYATTFVRLFADRMVSLAKMIDHIKQGGGTVDEAWDPYILNDTMMGQTQHLVSQNGRLLYDPMKNAMFSMGYTKADFDALSAVNASAKKYLGHTKDVNNGMLGLYGYARHASERNAVEKVKNPNGKPMLDDNGRPVKDQWWASDALSGMSSEDAAQIMKFFENSKNFAKLKDAAAKLDAIIADTNVRRVDAGLMPADFKYDPNEGHGKVFFQAGVYADDAKTKLGYKHYVPLRGFADDIDYEDTAPAHARGFQTLRREDPRAMGRGSMAAKIVENVLYQNEQAIIRAQRAKVGQAFLKVIRENPDLAKGFARIIPEGGAPLRWTMVDGAYKIVGRDPAGEKVVLGKGDGLHGRLQFDPLYKNRPDNPYFTIKEKKLDENGKETGDVIEQVIEIYDDSLRRAMKGEIGLKSEALLSLVNHVGQYTRFLANLATSWNPEFLFMNMQRDIASAGINLQQFELDGLSKDMVKRIPASLKTLYMMTPKTRLEYLKTGKAEYFVRDDVAKLPFEKQKDANLALDFIEDGGSIEFMGMRELADITSHINDQLRDPASFSTLEKTKGAIGRIGDFIESYNKIVENGTRLSVYGALREALEKNGMDGAKARQHAARAAKNMTANFNRGGELKSIINALYMFYNASIQGTFGIVTAAKNSKKVQQIMAGIMVAGAAQDALMGMISPEDENGQKVYDNIPEWALRNRMIFIDPFGVIPKGYLAIPMPYGFNAMYNFGRSTMRGLRGGYSPGEAASSAFGAVVDAFNPLGGTTSLLNFVAPTVLDPIIDLSMNEDFKGDPIAKTPSAYGVRAPQSQLHWNSTTQSSISIAEWLNYLSGGDVGVSGAVDVSPDQIDYVAGYLTGGAGRFIGRMANGAEKVFTGNVDDLTPTDVPILRAYVGGVSDKSLTEDFIEARQEVLQPAKAIKDASEAGDIKAANDLRRQYKDKVKLMGIFQAADSARNKLSNRLRQIERNERIPEATKQVLVKQLRKLMHDQENRALRAYHGGE